MKLALVLLLVFASPAVAQETRTARIVSDVAVWSAIGLDTWQQATGDDPKHALGCEALRMGVTLGASELTKRLVHRERPDHSDHKSFYSMHTAMAGQAAGWRYEIGIPLMAVAAIGRVQAKRHYWSDVAVGAAAGLATSRLCGEDK